MPFSIRTLAMTVAHSTPEQQRALLGENLYPLVEEIIEPYLAPKVTGMLLELDRIEVLNLIESPTALKSKVYEALEVLRSTDYPSLRALLGANLYPLVEELEPHTAPKVTGMLLELDPMEVSNLLQSPSALKSKVSEAMEVLRSVDHPSLRNANVDGGMARGGASTCYYRQPPGQIRALKAALEHATPDEGVALLGSNLYPLVHKLLPINAGKVTGMLLELDKAEVLHLIQSPKALKSMVGEAMKALNNVDG